MGTGAETQLNPHVVALQTLRTWGKRTPWERLQLPALLPYVQPLIISGPLSMHDLKWCCKQVPSSLGARRASPAFPAPSSHRQEQRSAYLETTPEPGNSSGLEGREAGCRALAAQAVYRWATLLTFLNLSFLPFKVGQ